MKFLFLALVHLILFCAMLEAKPQHGENQTLSEATTTAALETPSSEPQKKEAENKTDADKKKEKEDKGKKEKEEKEKKKKKKKEDENPWFVGTLLAIFGENIPPGKFLIEPIISEARLYGVYDSNSSLIKDRNTHLYTLMFLLETGITKKIDVSLYLTEVYTSTSFGTSTHFADILLAFGFQVATDKKGSWIPDLRVLPGMYFPTGKFDHLNPLLRQTDATGTGAYRPTISFVVEKRFYNIPKHPYNLNFNFTIIHHTKVDVKGVNFFDDDPNSNGTFTPGERFIFNLAFEYKITKNWGWGLDIHYDYQNSSSFHNKGGSTTASNDPSFYQFSMAPEIEYDLSAEIAFSFGLWYTLAGRNNFAFFTGLFLFSYEF